MKPPSTPGNPAALALTIPEARLIGDLMGQKDAGIEMLAIRLDTPDAGRTIRAEFRTPLGIFSFSDCEVSLDRSMAALVDVKTDAAPTVRLAQADKVNADRYAQPTRKIRFD